MQYEMTELLIALREAVWFKHTLIKQTWRSEREERAQGDLILCLEERRVKGMVMHENEMFYI